jgi:hypothetical protein
VQPAHRPRHPRSQNRPGRPIQPARRSRLRGKYVFLFGSHPPESAASPSSLCQPGPIYQIHPLPLAGRPRSEIHRASDATEPLQPSLITLPPQSPSNRALTSLNALNVYSPHRYSGHPSRRPPPAPIKGRGAPLGHHHTHLALNHVLSSPRLLLTERRLPVLHHRRLTSTAPPELR